MLFAIYDEATNEVLGAYSAPSPDLSRLNNGRPLQHARVPAGVQIAFSRPQLVNGEWVAVEIPGAPPAYTPPPPDPVKLTEAAVSAAMVFGQQMLIRVAAENVRLGITQAGKTRQVRETLGDIVLCLLTGSLYDAMSLVRAIPADKKDDTFITDARLLSFINEIEAFLGMQKSTSL